MNVINRHFYNNRKF